jgi:hypothetical protein
VPLPRAEPPAIGVTGFLRRVTDLGLGAASLAAQASVDAVERFVPTDGSKPPSGPPEVLRLLPGALFGLGLVAQQHLLDASAATERTLEGAVGALVRSPVVGAPLRATEEYLERWSSRGESEQSRNRALLGEFIRRLAPELATAVIAQLDIDRLIEQLPIDAIISEVDIDALLTRVDVDGIVSRVDLEALMNRIDIGPIAVRVLDEVDIGAIVRESTGSVTGDMLNGGRVSAMRLDAAIAKVSDKLLLRRRPRKHDVPRSGILGELADDALEPEDAEAVVAATIAPDDAGSAS